MYELAFNFWRLLATEEVKLGASVALINPRVPLLLSNAAWFPEADDLRADDFQVGNLQAIATWYAKRDIVPALIVPALRAKAFSEALAGSAFSLERAFTFQTLEEPLQRSTDLITEQVSWAQGRVLGEHLAAHYEGPEYGVALGAAVTSAMQRCPHIISFVTYSANEVADEVVGALVAFENEGSLSSMMHSGEVEARLYQEAASREVQASSLEPLPAGVTVGDSSSFERWSIR